MPPAPRWPGASVDRHRAGSSLPTAGVFMEIVMIGLTALLCATTYLVYRVAAALQEHK